MFPRLSVPPLAVSVPPELAPDAASCSESNVVNVAGASGDVTVQGSVSNELLGTEIDCQAVELSEPLPEEMSIFLIWKGCIVGLVSVKAPVARFTVASTE